MIRRLRIKFILISGISIFIVLSLIIATINILNYKKVRDNADNITDVLYSYGGSFERFRPEEEIIIPDEGEETEQGFIPPNRRGINEETPFDTRYFTVKYSYDSDNNIVINYSDVNLRRISRVTFEEAKQYAIEVINGDDERGYNSYFRYLNKDIDGQNMIIFIDCEKQIESADSFLLYSIIISLIGVLTTVGLIILLSFRIFRPVNESYLKQRRFIQNAGHELRTPLTVISANNELNEIMNGENETTKAISKQTSKLTNMVQSLITLSMLEEDRRIKTITKFNITNALNEIIDSFSTIINDKNLNLELDIEPDLSYVGEEGLIKILFSILIDNSIKYAISNIKIILKDDGKNISFSCINDDKTLSMGPHPELFERFYRAPGQENKQGSGIGLSIAKDIIDVHKSKIDAINEDDKFIINVSLKNLKIKK